MENAIMNGNFTELENCCKVMRENGKGLDLIKVSVDELLHKKALYIAEKNKSDPNILDSNTRKLISFVFRIAKQDLCSKSTTVSVMQDIFDTQSIAICEQIFSIVEDNLANWKTVFFYEACKNTILRMCNDLLKRLSRTINTSFCGRILVLLARALPLCEKSGLNLVSHFNINNFTKYDLTEVLKEPEPGDESEEVESGEIKESGDIPVDFGLYAKFWQLQSFFVTPTNCYDRSKWKAFQQNTSDVLSVLLSHKLGGTPEMDEKDEKDRRIRKRDAESAAAAAHHHPSASEPMDVSTVEKNEDTFFAKYVTSQKLLQLQLNDSQFRRYFLVQCLVLYQYLVSDIKFKDKSFVLHEDQLRFIIESTEKCYRLLRDTHPKGDSFADSIKKILQREEQWSEWKNRGCSDYTALSNDKDRMMVMAKRPRMTYKPNEIDLGSAVLTNLWKINPDMIDACQDRKRKFAPSMVEFLQDPLLELDPEQMVEDQYKAINNESFQWRASRMLLQNSQHYFQIPCKRNEVTATMGPFLEELIKQTALAIPELKGEVPGNKSSTEVKADSANEVAPNGPDANSCTSTDSSQSISSSLSPLISDKQIEQLSGILANNCEKLKKALFGEQNDDTLQLIPTEETSKGVVQLLSKWKEREEDGASVKKLSSILLAADLFSEQVASVFKATNSTVAKTS